MYVQWNYANMFSILLTKVTLQVGSLRDPVDPDHGGVPDGVQHVGHDAHLLLLGHLHRMRSLSHRGKILGWMSLVISPSAPTCQVWSDKGFGTFSLRQRRTSSARSHFSPWQIDWTHRWSECICRLNIWGCPCYGDIFSSWSHDKVNGGSTGKLRSGGAVQG